VAFPSQCPSRRPLHRRRQSRRRPNERGVKDLGAADAAEKLKDVPDRIIVGEVRGPEALDSFWRSIQRLSRPPQCQSQALCVDQDRRSRSRQGTPGTRCSRSGQKWVPTVRLGALAPRSGFAGRQVRGFGLMALSLQARNPVVRLPAEPSFRPGCLFSKPSRAWAVKNARSAPKACP
jgi:hypothetical protein